MCGCSLLFFLFASSSLTLPLSSIFSVSVSLPYPSSSSHKLSLSLSLSLSLILTLSYTHTLSLLQTHTTHSLQYSTRVNQVLETKKRSIWVQDSQKRKLPVTKENFFLVTLGRTRKDIAQSWFQNLAGNKPLSQMAKRVNSFIHNHQSTK